MLCKVCTDGLQGIWDPRKTERVCLMQEFQKAHPPMEDSKFVTEIWTYKVAEQHNPQSLIPENYVFGHHHTQKSFENSIRDGCVMCQIFKPGPEDTQTRPDSNIAAYGYYSLFSVIFQDCPIMSLYVHDYSGGFELCRHIEDKNWNLNISPSTGDNATWVIIQIWLDSCLKSHSRCNEKLGPASMPARLIQLDHPSGKEANFRIVPGTQVDPGTRYIAVSHCCDMGTGEHELQLTKSCLGQLSTSQSVSILPLTFRDTLVIAARLGITHIWVDRLCTLQDDLDEQTIEANRRPDVFRNAFLAVGASGTASAASGLFATRDPALVAPTVFDFPVDAQGTTAPYISSCEHPQGWENDFHADPLSRSARAIRDRLFAPRMVHFGSKMVFWECYHARCAEIHPHGAYGPALGSIYLPLGANKKAETSHSEAQWTNMPWKSLLNTSAQQTKYRPAHQVFFDWVSLLEMYSGCKVATPEERVHGLDGIAEYMKVMLQERGCMETEYVAGMWKAMLPASLMWNIRGSRTRAPACQVPSWSWAAVDGKLNFPLNGPYDGDRDELLCELVRAGAAPCDVEQDDTEVLTERLILKGKLALAKLHPRMNSPRLYGDPKVLIRRFVNDDVGGACLGEPTLELPSEYNYEWAVLFDTDEDISDETLCLPIRIESAGSLGYLVQGLALSRLDNGCYVRQGKWEILVDGEEDGLSIFHGLPERMMELV